MLKRLSSLSRFVLGLAGIMTGLAVIAALWAWLPVWPRLTLASAKRPPENGARIDQTITVSPDGRWLAVRHEGQLEVWDTSTGAPRTSVPAAGSITVYREQVTPLAWFSPDGRVL